jgi:hypothetical protein
MAGWASPRWGMSLAATWRMLRTMKGGEAEAGAPAARADGTERPGQREGEDGWSRDLQGR